MPVRRTASSRPVAGAVRTARIAEDTRPRPDARAERVFRQAVAHETLLARDLGRDRGFGPDDPRWKLAVETQRALQGAMLAFEDRRRLLSLAQRLGIRAFDANLIVALVQDRARRGEPIESAAATIAIVPVPTAHGAADGADAPRRDLAWLWVAAVMTALVVDAVLIGWLIFR